MPEGRIVKGIITVSYSILIADTNCKPVTTILFDFKSNSARPVAFLLKGRLHQAEMIVVTFGRFDHIFTDNRYAVMFEFVAKFELYFGLEKARIFCSFL